MLTPSGSLSLFKDDIAGAVIPGDYNSDPAAHAGAHPSVIPVCHISGASCSSPTCSMPCCLTQQVHGKSLPVSGLPPSVPALLLLTGWPLRSSQDHTFHHPADRQSTQMSHHGVGEGQQAIILLWALHHPVSLNLRARSRGQGQRAFVCSQAGEEGGRICPGVSHPSSGERLEWSSAKNHILPGRSNDILTRPARHNKAATRHNKAATRHMIIDLTSHVDNLLQDCKWPCCLLSRK